MINQSLNYIENSIRSEENGYSFNFLNKKYILHFNEKQKDQKTFIYLLNDEHLNVRYFTSFITEELVNYFEISKYFLAQHNRAQPQLKQYQKNRKFSGIDQKGT